MKLAGYGRRVPEHVPIGYERVFREIERTHGRKMAESIFGPDGITVWTVDGKQWTSLTTEQEMILRTASLGIVPASECKLIETSRHLWQ